MQFQLSDLLWPTKSLDKLAWSKILK